MSGAIDGGGATLAASLSKVRLLELHARDWGIVDIVRNKRIE